MKTVTIFGSSRPIPGDPDYETARETGRLLATAGFTICNGGYGGTMEATARGAKEAGGSTVGVTSEFFSTRANLWIDQNIVVKTLIDRLMRLIEVGDGYVVLKGGTGTLLELACIWELMNKRAMHVKPIVVLGNFWSDLVKILKKELTLERLTDATKYVVVLDTPEQCVRHLKNELLHLS